MTIRSYKGRNGGAETQELSSSNIKVHMRLTVGARSGTPGVRMEAAGTRVRQQGQDFSRRHCAELVSKQKP